MTNSNFREKIIHTVKVQAECRQYLAPQSHQALRYHHHYCFLSSNERMHLVLSLVKQVVISQTYFAAQSQKSHPLLYQIWSSLQSVMCYNCHKIPNRKIKSTMNTKNKMQTAYNFNMSAVAYPKTTGAEVFVFIAFPTIVSKCIKSDT